jgi:hypothetical protein
MAMNFAPLDCPCQGASSESKKNLPGFFHFRENRKKTKKSIIFGSHSKSWVQWPELLLYLNSTDPIQ